MAIREVLNVIRERHQPHASRPAGECDACLLLGLLALAHGALDDIQRMSSMSQWDPQAVAEAIRQGRGW